MLFYIIYTNLKGDWTPLQSAIGYRGVETVKLLLAAGADVHKQNYNKETPLHSAASYGNCAEICKLLLAAGAHINKQDKEGNTPLHAAANNYDTESLQVLLAAGADMNIQNRKGNTPLHMAAKHSYSSDACELLLSAGADVYIFNKKRKTPIDMMRTWCKCNKDVKLYAHMKKLEDEKVKLSMIFKRARVDDSGDGNEIETDGNVSGGEDGNYDNVDDDSSC